MKRFWLTTVFTLHALFAPFLVLNVFSDATLPYENEAVVKSFADHVSTACVWESEPRSDLADAKSL